MCSLLIGLCIKCFALWVGAVKFTGYQTIPNSLSVNNLTSQQKKHSWLERFNVLKKEAKGAFKPISSNIECTTCKRKGILGELAGYKMMLRFHCIQKVRELHIIS